VLGPGTAVDALSNWSSGAPVRSSATMSYSFEATGPASVDFIPIEVLSKGLLAVAGDGTANLSLVIRDAGTDANIPPGVPDPDPDHPLLDLTAHCSHGKCSSSWDGHLVTDTFCVVNGDNYVITISATTTAGPGGQTNRASAVLDPEIKVDPPYPKTCPVDVSPSELKLATGPGASTGFVPEPSALSLVALAAIALGLRGRRQQLAQRS